MAISIFIAIVNLNLNFLSALFTIPFYIIYLLLERLLINSSLSALIGGLLGLIVGVITGFAISIPFSSVMTDDMYSIFSLITILVTTSSLCLVGSIKGSKINISSIRQALSKDKEIEDHYILDTSVIIDGRIVDIVDAGFLSGIIVIPQFVIQEIQHIADSPDGVRRMRGKRAIEILKKMQSMPNLTVKIVEEDFPKIKEVDSKIIALAKKIGAKIVTNDYNLQKIAQLQDIKALNVNELSKMLKTVVVPGETLNIFIVKEGKEPNQGVAYLEDGTMVVIENGKAFIGKSLEVEVTSVLQTTGGRIIFTKPKENE
ncbi:MAG: PIN domain-containing protein [Thermodesulfovibrionales bacterium]|nr:PIN domain-containing protein [Thermodesulfovibrionales bacterium]